MKKRFSNFLFPNPSSFEIKNLINFNNFILIFILILIIITLIYFILNKIKTTRYYKWENEKVECFWTSFPRIILLAIAIPSILILYQLEETHKPMLRMKVFGNQWFWTSEYPQLKNRLRNIIIIKSSSIRCLITSNPIVTPCLTPIKIIISRNDVIHSFSINNLALKSDAIPGRINTLQTEIIKPGTSTGQCSEICGINHSFMPIIINSLKIF